MRAASHHAFRVTARLSKLLFKPSLYIREYCLFSGYNREIAKENAVKFRTFGSFYWYVSTTRSVELQFLLWPIERYQFG